MYEDSRPPTKGGTGSAVAPNSSQSPSPSPNPQKRTNTNPKANSRKPNIFRASHSLAWHDVRTRWRRGLLWTSYLTVLLIIILALAIAASSSTPAGKPKFDDQVACLPDGTFSLDPKEFNFWGWGGFFEITMGYGTFTFTQAKVLDVGWDVVIGRGGQAVLAVISSSVFARYVTTTMQTAPVTFNTFKSIFLARDANTAVGLSRLIRDFTRRKCLPNKVATIFMVLTMVFILVFPTFASAMSGYSANVQAFVEDQGKRYVPFSDFTPLYYIIHDGHRLNLSDEYRVTGPGEGGEPLLRKPEQSVPRTTDDYILSPSTVCADRDRRNSPEFQKQCQFLEDVTNYILDYGTESATNNATIFGCELCLSPDNRPRVRINITEGPSLNITAHYVPYDFLGWVRGLSWNSPAFELRNPMKILTPTGRNLNILDPSRMAWTAGTDSPQNTNTSNEAASYDQAWIEQHGRCQPTKTYKWGFSFIQLFLMVLLLTCWVIGIYTLYIRSHIVMYKKGHDTPIAGEYQAVFQLAEAMNAQLDQEPETIEKAEKNVLSEEQLRQRISKDLKGGAISYKDSLLHNQDVKPATSTWRTRDWIQNELFWLILLALAVMGCLLTAWYYPTIVALYLLPLQLMFAIYVGQTGKSRVVLLVWQLLVLSVGPTVAAIMTTI